MACAELLLAEEFDVNAANFYARTPLHLAAESNETCTELLLAKGADVRAIDKDGETPLHRAAYAGHLNCAELLVSEGANVLAKDTYDHPPKQNRQGTADA